MPVGELDLFGGKALRLMSVAGLCSLPQMSLPMGEIDGCPIGLSLIAAPDRDVDLLAPTDKFLPPGEKQ
jgi:amidase